MSPSLAKANPIRGCREVSVQSQFSPLIGLTKEMRDGQNALFGGKDQDFVREGMKREVRRVIACTGDLGMNRAAGFHQQHYSRQNLVISLSHLHTHLQISL